MGFLRFRLRGLADVAAEWTPGGAGLQLPAIARLHERPIGSEAAMPRLFAANPLIPR
jgi:hypothetical protein